MSHNDVREIEMSIEGAKKKVAMFKALERLEKNRDFKKLIQEEYLHNEAVRLVHLKSDPSMQSQDNQRLINQDIDGIGSFAQFINKIAFEARMAEDAIRECEDTLDDLRGEDGGDE